MRSKTKNFIVLSAVAIFLVGCEGGDVNISPTTTDNSQDNSETTTNIDQGTEVVENPCAFYVKSGQTFEGDFDGRDCSYSSIFVDSGNPLTEDLLIPALPGDGVHQFTGSLVVGEKGTMEELAAAGITEGGDGPTVSIEAGVTMTWPSPQKFVSITRGSQIIAVGEANAPITFTSFTDVATQRGEDDLAFDAVGEWGGMLINGFGITNKCAHSGGSFDDDDLVLASSCDVDTEGLAGNDETPHGGDNNNDSSGRLEYVVVKHTGAQIGEGNEINGITFGAVGRNTIVRNIQTYSTLDDGIELFGGALNIENFVSVFARDDSIDLDAGWRGTINNALVIHNENLGNGCIESDGIASYSSQSDERISTVISQGINTRPVINNLTCIVSGQDSNTGDRGEGVGIRFREGIWPTLNDSMVVMAFSADDADTNNYCVRFGGDEEVDGLLSGDASFNSVIFACVDKTKGGPIGADSLEDFLEGSGSQFADSVVSEDDPTATSNTSLVLLEGTPPIYSVAVDSMVINDAAPTVPAPASGRIGALSTAIDDWTAGWTYGIHEDSRGAPLWFE
jgi:hypothetical protein